jgi:hypothetical protein
MEAWHVTTKHEGEMLCKYVMENIEKRIMYEIQQEQRSKPQNAALHSCLRRLAKGLNNAGFGIAHPLKPDLEIPYTEENCKELLLRPIIQAMYSKTSTASLTKEEVSKSMDVLLNRISELTGVVEGFTLAESKLLNAKS